MAERPRRARALGAIVAVQALATIFFVGDALADLRAEGLTPHILIEALIALALLAGVVFGLRELRHLLDRAARDSQALAAASGALADLVEARFAQWGLTAAEADVAMLALKGFDSAEIAGLRGSAPGTVRAQLAQVYAKAGVGSRAALVSLFFDDLLDGLPIPRG